MGLWTLGWPELPPDIYLPDNEMRPLDCSKGYHAYTDHEDGEHFVCAKCGEIDCPVTVPPNVGGNGRP